MLPSDDVRCGVIVLVRQLGLSPDLTSGVCPSLPVYISQTEKHVLTEMNTCWRARITKTTTVTAWRSDRGFLLSDGCQLVGLWTLVLKLGIKAVTILVLKPEMTIFRQEDRAGEDILIGCD